MEAGEIGRSHDAAKEDEAVRDWSELPADMVRLCASRLDCNVDLMNMSFQCTAWRDALGGILRAVQLPWMLIPYRRTCLLQPDILRRSYFFCFLSKRAHKVPMPSYAYGARFIGCYGDGWLFVAFGHTAGYAIINLSTRVQIHLPSNVLCGAFPHGEPMVLRSATLSGSPTHPSACVVGAICTTLQSPFLSRTFLAFCRVGASVFSCVSEVDAEDIIHIGLSFYCLTRLEDMIICTPEYNDASQPNSLHVDKHYLHFLPSQHEEHACVKARYLVCSRGEIMMIARYTTLISDLTSSFALFRMTPPADGSGMYYSWEKVPDLDGRMIFVGRGCSRAIEAQHFSRCQPGIYFHDDDSFNMPAMIAYGYNGRKYPCFDNGCWTAGGKPMKRWSEWRLPSTYTSPIWYFR